MKENNNIAIVLDALGEKIAALELELQCEKYKNAEMEKQIVEKDHRIMRLEMEHMFPKHANDNAAVEVE